MDDMELASKLGAIDATLTHTLGQIQEIKADIGAAKRTMFRAAWVIFLTVVIILLGRFPEVVTLLTALRGL